MLNDPLLVAMKERVLKKKAKFQLLLNQCKRFIIYPHFYLYFLFLKGGFSHDRGHTSVHVWDLRLLNEWTHVHIWRL